MTLIMGRGNKKETSKRYSCTSSWRKHKFLEKAQVPGESTSSWTKHKFIETAQVSASGSLHRWFKMQRVLAVLFLAQICGIALGDFDTERLCNYCDGKLELGIILDSSSSISRDDFSKAQAFLKQYLKKFNVSPDAVRVSVITYGRVPHPEDSFNLTTYNNNEDVAAAIGNIRHRATTYTATGEAIRFMREHQLGRQFVRAGVPKVSVVITDGNSQEPALTEREARQARDQGIVIFAIGVGSQIDNWELENIAGDRRRVDRVDNYDKLITITEWLAKETCVKK